VCLQLSKPRGHLEGTQHQRLLISTPSVYQYQFSRWTCLYAYSQFPIRYRVGVSLCQAQISLVGGTWKGFLMTLLGLKIIEWTAVSDFDHEDGGLTGPRSPPNQPNRSLRYKWAGHGVPFPSFLFCICPARGHPVNQPVS
jgi:hypothetical protein